MSSDLKHNEHNFLPQWFKKFQIPNWKRLAFALSSIKPIDCIAHIEVHSKSATRSANFTSFT